MNYYDETSKGYNELHEEEQKDKINFIKKHIKNYKKILDVGCGTGLSCLTKDTIGVDPSKELLKQCKNKTIQAEAENLPFKDEEFDLVTCITAVHNFKDIEKGLKEIKRVAKKDVVLTILKKSPKHDQILGLIKKVFKTAIKDQGVDTICFCEK